MGAPVYNPGESYAVLVVDEKENDRLIREALADIGDFISESSQEILIDDFGSAKMIPLDSYNDEIEASDPRNDGYAEKLGAFFVHDGKRFFFLPLDARPGTAKLKKQIASALGDMPFSLTILGQRNFGFLFFIIFALSCGGALYLSNSRRLFIYIVPVLLAVGLAVGLAIGLAFGRGALSAFVLTALLAGLWELLREPSGELSVASNYAGSGIRGGLERLKPFRLNLILAFLFIVFYTVYSVTQGLFPIPAALGLFGFFLFYFLAFRAKAKRIKKTNHILFIPVLLPPYKVRTFSLVPLLLPFGAGALLMLFLPVFLQATRAGYSHSGDKDNIVDIRYLVNDGDYDKHISYQNSFSYRSLNDMPGELDSGVLMQENYLQYYLGKDGLIAGSSDYSGGGFENCPFPLEKLMDFLVNYYETKAPVHGYGAPDHAPVGQKELLSVAVIMAVCLLDFIRPRPGNRKKKKENEYVDKRIAA